MKRIAIALLGSALLVGLTVVVSCQNSSAPHHQHGSTGGTNDEKQSSEGHSGCGKHEGSGGCQKHEGQGGCGKHEGQGGCQKHQATPEMKELNELNQKGLECIQNKKYDEALKCFNKILDKVPDDAGTLYNIACTYSLMNKKEKAIQYLSKAVEAGYTDVNWIKNDRDLDNIRQEKEYQEIIERVKETEHAGCQHEGEHQMTPEMQELAKLYQEGVQYYQSGQYQKAVKCFNQVLEKEPKAVPVLYNAACTYSLMGEKDKAIDYLAKAVENGFNDKQHIEQDKDLDNIRREKGYLKVIESIKSEGGCNHEGGQCPKESHGGKGECEKCKQGKCDHEKEGGGSCGGCKK